MDKNAKLIAVGAIIRRYRKARGFTQESFADHAGLDRTYYGAIERGERNLAALNIIRIAEALEVQVGELFPIIRYPLESIYFR